MFDHIAEMAGQVITHVVIATIVAIPIASWNYAQVQNDVSWIKQELIYQRNKLDKLTETVINDKR